MLVGIIAILSCGAQYVPLDGGVVPDTTLRTILEQCKAKVVLSLASTEYRLSNIVGGSFETVVISDNEVNESEDESYPFVQHFVDLAREDSGCHVIYTSGTTGAPKGVDVKHSNVINLVCLSPGDLGIRPGTRVGCVMNISFDMATWEILASLCNGGTLIMRGSDWNRALREIDVLVSTPSILAKYSPAQFPNIRTVATAGEPSEQKLADLWASHCTYYNGCGPAETTIVNTMHKHIPGGPLTIGTPTPNNTVYVLDDDLNLVPFGEQGMMWAGGHGISAGYVHLPETTAARYKPDPFANNGSMMYNTGDLGRWTTDGSLEILGRFDDQVKVDGFRVELDGVSASLKSCPGVTRATVLLINGEIHSFVEPASVELAILGQHIAMNQPYYAVPGKFHFLDALPETSNGKLDKQALRSLAEAPVSEKAFAFRGSTLNNSEVILAGSDTSGSLKDTRTSSNNSSTYLAEKLDLTTEIPEKLLQKPFRGVIYRIFIVYRFLFSLVGLGNLAALIAMCVTGVNRQWLSNMTAIDLCLAVVIRQDFLVNALYAILCSVPNSWPLFIRRKAAKIYHFGGVHSGAAVCAGLWLLASNIYSVSCQVAPNTCYADGPTVSVAPAVIAWILTGLFFVMFGFAWPPFRRRNHNVFEKVHRFVGWTMVGLFWAQIVLSINDSRPASQSVGAACVRAPAFWLLTVASISIAITWFHLRKVKVQAEVLSPHAVRLHFDYAVPVNGSFARVSTSPLLEWHSFATISAPEIVNDRPKGHSVVVSNAGDWTQDCIRNPPTWLWTRGVPTCGVMRIAPLFNRVVLIATGSGIGPMLGHIVFPQSPTQLIWSTPSPEQTFGRGMLDAIHEKIPDAIIHDTKVLGRPDLVRMGYNLAKDFRAEAVIIIANEKITKKVVYGLETRGIYAYGAIWDS